MTGRLSALLDQFLLQPDWRPTLRALGGSAASALLAYWLGFPAPFVTGPSLFLALLAILTPIQLNVLPVVRNVAFVLIGLTIGSAATPDLIAAARSWPLSILALVLALGLIMLLGGLLLQRLFGYPRREALLCCIPGHLSLVIALASEDPRTDARLVTLVQSIRLLILTLALPFALKLLGLMPPGTGLPQGGTFLAPLPLLLLVLISTALGLLALRWRVPAALLLSAMAVSMMAHALGWVKGAPPTALSVSAFVIIGALIGSRFSGVTLAQLRQALLAGLASTLLAFLVSLTLGLLIAPLVGVDPVTILIAFAPGGLETMAALAIIMQADATFVAAHHLARMLTLPALVTAFLLLQRRIGR